MKSIVFSDAPADIGIVPYTFIARMEFNVAVASTLAGFVVF